MRLRVIHILFLHFHYHFRVQFQLLHICCISVSSYILIPNIEKVLNFHSLFFVFFFHFKAAASLKLKF